MSGPEQDNSIQNQQDQAVTSNHGVEFLMSPPKMITRPLCLIDGHAYAGTWLWTRVPTPDKNGQIIQVEGRRLYIIRDDGVLFGVGGDSPIQDLGLTVHLPDIPSDSRLWSMQGVQDYRNGARPDAVQLFQRIIDIVNCFIDFDRSLADQQTMCEMIGCYVLSTWFLDAFNVIGYLWPNGERGSGKTQLLAVITELAYLGQMILAGASYASLRDLADYGATLAFDDAENLADGKRIDPDKRALLLAGNRRGSTVALKESMPDNKYRTRYVNTYCARLFSAIRLPDPVLASRTIIVPLLRSPDRGRANADPLDHALWPHARQQLIDDLWALALTHLPALRHCETYVNQQATLIGRNLEPWRPLLAVAKWLNDQGVAGLWARLETLSQRYQTERQALEPMDLTQLVIRVLCQIPRCASSASSAGCASNLEGYIEWEFTTEWVKQWCLNHMAESEVPSNIGAISSEKVGRALGGLRLRQIPRPGGKGSRIWSVSMQELGKLALAYCIPLPEALAANSESIDDQYTCSVPLFLTGPTGFTGSTGSLRPLPDDFDIDVDWDEIPDEWEGVGSQDSLWGTSHH